MERPFSREAPHPPLSATYTPASLFAATLPCGPARRTTLQHESREMRHDAFRMDDSRRHRSGGTRPPRQVQSSPGAPSPATAAAMFSLGADGAAAHFSPQLMVAGRATLARKGDLVPVPAVRRPPEPSLATSAAAVPRRPLTSTDRPGEHAEGRRQQRQLLEDEGARRRLGQAELRASVERTGRLQAQRQLASERLLHLVTEEAAARLRIEKADLAARLDAAVAALARPRAAVVVAAPTGREGADGDGGGVRRRPATGHVRDSELLRALQAAERRIALLEAQAAGKAVSGGASGVGSSAALSESYAAVTPTIIVVPDGEELPSP